MNGDSPISQPFGSLRIANPDDPSSSPSSPASPPPPPPQLPPPQLSPDTSHHNLLPAAAASTLSSSPPGPQLLSPALSNASSPLITPGALDSSIDSSHPHILPFPSADVDGPLHAYSPPSHQSPTSSPPSHPSYLSPSGSHGFPSALTNASYVQPPESRFRRLSHRQSMPLTYQAQQQIQYSSTNRPRNLPQPHSLPRPVSGLYNHPNMSSSSGPTPESTYQRARAESGQSANGLVRERSNGQPPLQVSASTRETRAERSHRQLSQSNPQPNGQRVIGRMAGGPDPGYGSGSVPSSTTLLSAAAYSGEGVILPSSEEWKDRGAAVTTKREVDASGKTVTRTVKKGVKDFHFGRTLGEGSYSTVLAATDRQTSKEYAIKVLDKKHIIKEKKVKYVNIEKDTLNRLTDHPGIVRLYYTFQDERSLYFVLDLALGGELLGVLKKTGSFDMECTRFYGAQILDAIEYMHSRGIIHRDLKPENVLLDDQMHVKITDFGTAKILDLPPQFGSVSVNSGATNNPLDGSETDRAHSFVGTAEYVSPELLTDKNACKASDLWAFGCIVYQLLAGRPPFKAGNEYQTFQKIVALDYSFPDGFPPVARDLVEKLLILNPADRLPIDKIKSHPFFEGIQWGKSLWKQTAPRLRPFIPSSSTDAGTHATSVSSPADISSLRQPPLKTAPPSSNPSSGIPSSRPQPRLITALAPPSQLDIAWSPVLTKNNERILKLGNLVVYSAPAPHSPTSRSQNMEIPADTSSKFSRFFGSSTTKKRQRLVMITSAGRIVLAPAGGDKKEAKMVISLLDPDVSCKSLVDTKGYTVWCVFTRDKHLTFEDPKANTGDSGSSVRNTQEWLECVESAKNFASAQNDSSPPAGYAPDAPFADDLQPTTRSSPASPHDPDSGIALAMGMGLGVPGQPGTSSPGPRNILHKRHDTDGDSLKGRKRFSKRHSKNGVAAVF